MAASPFELPPGFRFHPTDEELVAFYLQRKVSGRKIDWNVIAEIDLYKHDPWDLPGLSCLPTKDQEWYFFNPPDKKYPRGSRTNRATKSGYWKATGKDRKVFSNAKVVGMKKTLVFYKGRAPNGARTDWVMHEYQLLQEEPDLKDFNDALVLCRVMKKSGPGPRSRNPPLPTTEYYNQLQYPSMMPTNRTNLSGLALGFGARLGHHHQADGNSRAIISVSECADAFGMCTEALNIAKDAAPSFTQKGSEQGSGWLDRVEDDCEDCYIQNDAEKEDSESEIMEQEDKTFNWNSQPALACKETST